MNKREIVLCDSVRVASGTYGGSLNDTAAPDLGAAVSREVLERSGLSADKVRTPVTGKAIQAGVKINAARQAAHRRRAGHRVGAGDALMLKFGRRAALIGALIFPFALTTVWAAPTSMDIHAAVRTGDVEQVDAALKAGAGLNSPDNWGRTPLIVALQQGKAPVVEMLIDRGASVAATDAWGRTPLLVATQLKNTAAIRLLLEKKSDVNAANRNDITPLISAAQTGNREAAAMLLRAGAAPDRADNLGWTALMWAAYRKDAAIVKLLLDDGADAARVGRDKSTALEIARNRGADAALIALLAEKALSGSSAAAAARTTQPQPAGTRATPKLSPVIDASRIIRGNPKAPITIFEYTDFQCPYCRYGAMAVDEVMARNEGQVRLILKQLPLPLLHPMAMSCARYFEAISMQSADKAGLSTTGFSSISGRWRLANHICKK
jgi:hypothetical protein